MFAPSFSIRFALLAFSVFCGLILRAGAQTAPEMLTYTVDPLTRYIHLSYFVPAEAPETFQVRCTWSPAGQNAWRPARVTPLLSETGLELTPLDDWQSWVREGILTERRAAGLSRTVVWNPYPEAQPDGKVQSDFRIDLFSPEGTALKCYQGVVQADHRDVLYLEDWSQVFQKTAYESEAAAGSRKWAVRSGLDASVDVTLGNELYGAADPAFPLQQLSYPLDLKGWYAIFLCNDPNRGGIMMRLSGDERSDPLSSRRNRQETFWRWARMEGQNLVIRQPYDYTGPVAGHLDYVKLTPLPADLVASLDKRYGGEVDKFVAGYWEPYSWAFANDVQETIQHRQPLSAFHDARIQLVDTQIGRFGMKVVYETRKTDPLLYSTIGDPVSGDSKPTTDNVGRMQQYTNTLDATIRYTGDWGMRAHANFGASNCYPGSPLQGDFSREHPDWMRGSALRFEVPEVRDYVLRLYAEALEIGAPGISLDYCRYPETIDSVETGNTIMHALRELANTVGTRQGAHIPILVRFPGTGVRRSEFFDYKTWAREGWVDYLCPSNIQGRHHHIDVTPYIEVTKGTACQVLPCLDGLDWGLPMPGLFLWRVQQVYAAGAPGVYVYQADGRVLSRPEYRRCMRLLASSEAVRNWWETDAQLRPQCSKGIYLNAPSSPEPAFQGYERVRVWVEGLPLGAMEMYLDDTLITRLDGPPYILGGEDAQWDKAVPTGEHRLRIRVQDGTGWLEQAFVIHGA